MLTGKNRESQGLIAGMYCRLPGSHEAAHFCFCTSLDKIFGEELIRLLEEPILARFA
jgi:hypothetical protein